MNFIREHIRHYADLYPVRAAAVAAAAGVVVERAALYFIF